MLVPVFDEQSGYGMIGFREGAATTTRNDHRVCASAAAGVAGSERFDSQQAEQYLIVLVADLRVELEPRPLEILRVVGLAVNRIDFGILVGNGIALLR